MKKWMKKVSCILLVFCLTLGILTTAGCGTGVKADISAYQEQEIVITGLKDGDFTVTAQELAELPCKNKKVTSASAQKDVTVQATGPLFTTFLEQYDCEATDFKTITFIASDGYTKQFKGEYFLIHTDVIMAICHDKEPLDEEEAPLRLVIPNATGDNWAYGIAEIKFEK